MHFGVTILGNNSALPAHGRHPTAQVVTFHDRKYLVDCGEGAQLQMSAYRIRRSRINHVFISHMHGDHYFGLIGLLNSYGLQNREHPLHIYGPAQLEQVIGLQLECANTHLPFPLSFTALAPGESTVILREEDLEVEAFPTNHRIPCFGFAFTQVHRKRKLLGVRATQYGIPPAFFHRLQDGEDYVNEKGERIANDQVTEEPPAPRRYAFCADTRYDESILPYIQGCDLMYHEATYLNGQAEKATSRYHSTSVQAATMAAMANAGRLLIGHFSSQYETTEQFLEECLPVFPRTELSREGVTYLV
jgi:ribonuclease Z